MAYCIPRMGMNLAAVMIGEIPVILHGQQVCLAALPLAEERDCPWAYTFLLSCVPLSCLLKSMTTLLQPIRCLHIHIVPPFVSLNHCNILHWQQSVCYVDDILVDPSSHVPWQGSIGPA